MLMAGVCSMANLKIQMRSSPGRGDISSTIVQPHVSWSSVRCFCALEALIHFLSQLTLKTPTCACAFGQLGYSRILRRCARAIDEENVTSSVIWTPEQLLAVSVKSHSKFASAMG